MARFLYGDVIRDGNGTVCNGATVSIFLAGTTTAATVYAASSGGAHVNSVTTASDGSYVFYVDQADYDGSQNFKIVASLTIGNASFTPATLDNIVIQGLPFATISPTTATITTANITTANITTANVTTENMAGAFNEKQATDIASGATVNIGAANGNFINITGVTTITAFDTIQAGVERTLTFAGILTLTYNASSLILPGAANITTAAGDIAKFRSLGSGNWTCVTYQRAAASPASASAAASSIVVSDANSRMVYPVTLVYDGVGNRSASPTPAINTIPVSDGSGSLASWIPLGLPSFVNPTTTNTTGQVLVDVSGLTFTLSSGKSYEFYVCLSCLTSNDSTGISVAMSKSGVGTGAVLNAIIEGSATSSTMKQEQAVLGTASSAYLTTANQTGTIVIRGYYMNGNANDPFKVQFLKVTSGTATILFNSTSISYFRITKIN